MFIPISHINRAEMSYQENRVLAKFQPLIKENNKINFEFGKNFDDWFSDRFATRKILIKLNHIIKLKFVNDIYSEEPRYFSKSSHWAFNGDWVTSDDKKEFKFEEFEKNIRKLNDFCNNNNIKLYILIAPLSAEVYEDEFKRVTNRLTVKNAGYDFANYSKSKNLNMVITPLNELKSVKSFYPYSKGDVHWNEYGGYIAYKTVMKIIRKDFPNLVTLNDDDFTITSSNYSKTDYNNYPNKGNLYRELNIPNKYLDTKYYHFEYKKLNDIKRTPDDAPDEYTYNKSALNPQTVYIIGSSYEECPADFFIETFQKVIKRRYNTKGNGKLQLVRFKDEVIKYKPDILLLVLLSHNISNFNDLFTEN